MAQDNSFLMVGVSTRQNSTNWVPFLQFKVDNLLLLETSGAQQAGWTSGIQALVEARGKKFSLLPIGNGLDLETILNALREKTSDPQPIYWNIGGGQKLQTLALVIRFQERIKEGCGDRICYSEPQTRSTTLLDEKGCLQLLPTVVHDITLQDIIKSFGYQLEKGNDPVLLWDRKGLSQTTSSLLSNKQLDFFGSYENRQKMFQYAYDLEFSPKESSRCIVKAIFGDGPQKLGQYFERVVQTRAAQIVAGCQDDKHHINEVWANVKVTSIQFPDDKQEFDVALITDFGTLIALDAKTYEFSKKDEDARTLNLNKVTGLYSEFWSVFPFFKKDITEKKSILQTNKEWKKLLMRPFQIKDRGGKMMVMTEENNTDFALCKKEKSIITICECEPNMQEAVCLHSLTGMLQHLQLMK